MISIKKDLSSPIVKYNLSRYVTGYEVISKNCKGYIDLELYTEKNESFKIYITLKKLIEKISTNFLIFNGSRQTNTLFKNSFHIVLNDKYFHCGQCVKIYIKNVFNNTDLLPDYSVYKNYNKLQLFRIPYYSKLYSYDMFKLVNVSKSIDKVITYPTVTTNYIDYYVTAIIKNKILIQECSYDILLDNTLSDYGLILLNQLHAIQYTTNINMKHIMHCIQIICKFYKFNPDKFINFLLSKFKIYMSYQKLNNINLSKSDLINAELYMIFYSKIDNPLRMRE